MTEAWANPSNGPDLHLDLTSTATTDRSGELTGELAGIRSRSRLEGALRKAVQTGRLRPDTRLPPSRSLAADLGIARNTVAEAYSQLVAEGWLEARVGAGTWVSRQARVAVEAKAVVAKAVVAKDDRPPRFDLRTGTPDLSLFPRSAWGAALRRAVIDAPTQALGNGDPLGRIELRTSLATYLSRARGVRVSPERVVICNGFTQSLALLAQVTADGGARSMAIERFGHIGYREVILRAGLQVHDLDIDRSGAEVETLTEEGAAVLTPAHQFPLGMALSAHRRTRAVEWARTSGGLVIEDDYDGEFRYDRAALGAMQALAPDQVVYAGTASKSLAPGIRLSWLVVPAARLDQVVEAKRLADRFTGVFEQLALAELIDSGGYDRHIRRCRLVYRRRRDRLVSTLQRRVPDATVSGLAAGLHALVELPERLTEAEAVEAARSRGLAVEGLSAYSVEPEGARSGLVVGYATPPEHAFTTALARLCASLQVDRQAGAGQRVRSGRSRPGSTGREGRAPS